MTRAGTRACIGCLGSGACWICEGSGSRIGSAARYVAGGGCHRCDGTGVCSLCRRDLPVQQRAVPDPELDTGPDS